MNFDFHGHTLKFASRVFLAKNLSRASAKTTCAKTISRTEIASLWLSLNRAALSAFSTLSKYRSLIQLLLLHSRAKAAISANKRTGIEVKIKELRQQGAAKAQKTAARLLKSRPRWARLAPKG